MDDYLVDKELSKKEKKRQEREEQRQVDPFCYISTYCFSFMFDINFHDDDGGSVPFSG